MAPIIPPGDRYRIVGRDRERAQLRQCLDNAIAGHGSLVLISGEAGIGKTTLVSELIEHAGEQGALVLSGGCYDLTMTSPYGSWNEAIRGYRPQGDISPLSNWLNDSDALQRFGSQSELFEEIERFFGSIAGALPLVLVLEDLHWSDQASLDLLRYLSHRIPQLGMLVVVSYRDDELTRRDPLLQHLVLIVRETDATRIELRRLDANAVRELVARYELDEAETERLVAYLEQRAAGNPFFTTELLRALEGEGTLAMSGTEARLGELDEGFLPSFVLQVIERRLAHLDNESREALEIAAVIGQEVPSALWASVSGLQPSSLDQTIARALDLYLMEETTDHQRLAFTHALVRDVLYQGVLPTRRRAWHRQTGEELAAMSTSDPATVAHHFQQAGDDRAIEWHLRAGNRTGNSAPFSAAIHFEQAAAMLEGDERRVREVGWLRYEAGVLLYHSGEPRSIEHLLAAERLGARAADPVLAAYARASRGQQRCARGDIRQGLKEFQQGAAACDALMETHHLPGPGEITADIQRALSCDEREGWSDQSVLKTAEGASQLRVNKWRGILTNWLSHVGHYREAVGMGETFLAEVRAAYGADHLNVAGVGTCHLGLGYACAALGCPKMLVASSPKPVWALVLAEPMNWSNTLFGPISCLS